MQAADFHKKQNQVSVLIGFVLFETLCKMRSNNKTQITLTLQSSQTQPTLSPVELLSPKCSTHECLFNIGETLSWHRLRIILTSASRYSWHRPRINSNNPSNPNYLNSALPIFPRYPGNCKSRISQKVQSELTLNQIVYQRACVSKLSLKNSRTTYPWHRI